ncbi:hypothetical protein MMC22_007126 [Lobaria immixta]|nr:hypothetical protein [Lobaria immixta]
MSEERSSKGTTTFESYTSHVRESSHRSEDGDQGSDLDGDFNVDEDYVETASLITYSATLGSQRVVNENDRYKVIYTTQCGTQGIGPTNSKQQELSTDASLVPAIFHDQIRAELIDIAREDGAYTHKPTKGSEATDITAFHPDQKDWQEKGANRPDVLKVFAKPENFANPQYNLGFMYFDRFLVIDHEGQPLRPFRGIPLTLSSKLEGWRAEAIRRSDPRVRNMDLMARMPVKVEGSPNGIPTRKPLVKINAIAGRQSRFREQAGAITWSRPTTSNVQNFLWSLLPQDCRDNNLALPRDLTQQERGQLLQLNAGTKPGKARKIPDADKGMTREQYIDGVQRRAAGRQGPRGGEARRHRKEATRRAIREATTDTLPDAPTSPQDGLELAEDVVAASHMPQLPTPDVSVIPAFTSLVTAPVASAAPIAPTPHVMSGAPAHPAASQLHAPLVRGLIDPPLAFVRPGQYLYDEPMVYFYRWNAFSS